MERLIVVVALLLGACAYEVPIPASKIQQYDEICQKHSGAWRLSQNHDSTTLICRDFTRIGL